MSKKTEEFSANRTIIGKIVGTHGIKGSMLLLPLTDYPNRFLDMNELVLEMPGKPSRTLKVKEITPYVGKNTFFLSVEGVTDKEAAENLKAGVITVSNDEKVELPEDEYWIDDMIGLRIIDNVTGCELGVLSEILPTGSNDVFMIKTAEGVIKPLPAIASVIIKVNIAEGNITVCVPEGLWN